MMRVALALLSGALFGAGLHVSGMTDTTKVRGFLDIAGNWDPTLAFVMGGAILPMLLAWRVARHMARRGAPLAGGAFPPAPSTQITPGLIWGSVSFGVGWGLVGLCPGPALASLTYGGWPGAMFFVAMALGMWLVPRLRRMLDSSAPST